MGVLEFVFIISSIITIINLYLIIKLNKKLESTESMIKQKIYDIDIDSKLNKMFSDKSVKSVDGLAGTLFKNVRKHFNLNAHSYSELVDEIKSCPQLKNELGELLIDFFNQMIQISYKKDEVSEEEKEQIRKEIKIIIKRLQQI
ncbi:MAG: hypothetical protein KAQ83_04800 [Nanoarchaeota archaeon]|nr:hypothetical protein [Nanoarchaeota archaeon]